MIHKEKKEKYIKKSIASTVHRINTYKSPHKNIIIFIIILILILTLCACTEQSKYTNFTDKVASEKNIKYLPISEQQGSISFGLVDNNGNNETQNIFYMNKNENFESFIDIGNFVAHDSKYKIVTFINYKQSDFYVDNKKCSDFTVNIKKQDNLQIPIKLQTLDEGYHDIIFAIVTYPDKFLKDIDREHSEMNHILYIRFNIVVENNKKDSYELTEFSLNNKEPVPEIFIHEDKDILKRLTSLDIKDNVNLYLTVGNIYDEEKEYAIIFLKDWKQISIYDNQEIIYTKLLPNQKFTIPFGLSFNEKGYHEINAILIEEPYQDYNINSSIANSIRVGIINN